MAKRIKKQKVVDEFEVQFEDQQLEPEIPQGLLIKESLKAKTPTVLLAEPFFSKSEKMIKRYFNTLSQYKFQVMNCDNFDQIDSSIVLLMNEFSIDLSSIHTLKNEFIVIVSDYTFIKKTNTIERTQCLFLNDYKLLFNLPVQNPNCIIYVYRKLHKTLN